MGKYDIDLYHIGKFIPDEFEKYLMKIGFNKNIQTIESVYDKRFMVTQFEHVNCSDNYFEKIPIQLINIIDFVQITDIIKSFDLSVCSNYTDGEKIFSMDINGIINSEFTINYQCKKTLIYRVDKYIRRGYKMKNFDIKQFSKEQLYDWNTLYERFQMEFNEADLVIMKKIYDARNYSSNDSDDES